MGFANTCQYPVDIGNRPLVPVEIGVKLRLLQPCNICVKILFSPCRPAMLLMELSCVTRIVLSEDR